MIAEPWFWRGNTPAASLARAALLPAALVYDLAQRLRAAATTPTRVGLPVICIGNATLGGAGKTPLAMTLHGLLKARGINACFQSRGYGGSLRGPVRVDDRHAADEVGDEALLLASLAPTFVAKDRLAGLCAAAAGGAELVIMDDGFQNPTIVKDVSLLVIDPDDALDGAPLFPAGPLREPLTRAVARADALILTGEKAVAIDAGARPIFRARRETKASIAPQRVVAFCGIGRPARFFASLEAQGFSLARRLAFPDHHAFSAADLERLRAEARKEKAMLITTEKDRVRLSSRDRDGVAIASLSLTIDGADALVSLIFSKIGRAP